MIMPNFLIIGAMKAGTTSLHDYLNQHPQIYMSPVKEPRFFALEEDKKLASEIENSDGLLWYGSITHLVDYQALFESVTVEQAIGETSPLYLAWSDKASRRIKHHIPHVKLIAILRNPVDRAYSHFSHNVKMGFETIENFSEALQADEINQRWWYKKQGNYYELLKPYFELFDRSQIKIYLYEDFQDNALNTLKNIFSFLEVDDGFVPDCSTRHNMSTRNMIENKKQQVTAVLRAQLLDEFCSDVLMLESLIHLDLRRWF